MFQNSMYIYISSLSAHIQLQPHEKSPNVTHNVRALKIVGQECVCGLQDTYSSNTSTILPYNAVNISYKYCSDRIIVSEYCDQVSTHGLNNRGSQSRT